MIRNTWLHRFYKQQANPAIKAMTGNENGTVTAENADIGGARFCIKFTIVTELTHKGGNMKRNLAKMESRLNQLAERNRLAKAWSNERQMAKVSNAYEANVMITDAVR